MILSQKNIEAVSYTHLDVYKRQYMQSEVNQEENLNRIITVPNLLSFFGFV